MAGSKGTPVGEEATILLEHSTVKGGLLGLLHHYPSRHLSPPFFLAHQAVYLVDIVYAVAAQGCECSPPQQNVVLPVSPPGTSVTAPVSRNQMSVVDKVAQLGKNELHSQLAQYHRTKRADESAVNMARLECRRQLLLSADVIVSTLSGAASTMFVEHVVRENVTLDTVIVDEAAQVCMHTPV